MVDARFLDSLSYCHIKYAIRFLTFRLILKRACLEQFLYICCSLRLYMLKKLNIFSEFVFILFVQHFPFDMACQSLSRQYDNAPAA